MMPILTSINGTVAQRVERPRATDAVGSVLRNAFACPSLPDDMAALLQRLDRPARPR